MERVNYMHSKPTKFCEGGAEERSLEQLGTVSLNVSDGENARQFLEEVSAHATQLLGPTEKTTTGEDGAYGVDQALRSAALNSLQKREGSEPPVSAAHSYSVFLLQVDRSKPGKIIGNFEPKSVSRW